MCWLETASRACRPRRVSLRCEQADANARLAVLTSTGGAASESAKDAKQSPDVVENPASESAANCLTRPFV